MNKLNKWPDLSLVVDDEEEENKNLPTKKSKSDKLKSGDELQKVMIPEDWVSPLQYMLEIMNDPTIHPDRRDKMAISAAGYIHPRVMNYIGKHEKQSLEAAKTIEGNEWGSILDEKE